MIETCLESGCLAKKHRVAFACTNKGVWRQRLVQRYEGLMPLRGHPCSWLESMIRIMNIWLAI